MFPDLQLEILNRFTAVEQYFRNSPKKPDLVGQMAKGLVFVQIYAIYEFTAKSAMRLAIEEIVSHKHKYSELHAGLLSVFLDPAVRSVRDSGANTAWENRLQMFEQCQANQRISPVTVLPSDGSHFRHTQILLILKALGVKRAFTRLKRHLYVIDSIVSNRHTIAHGGETAVDIGRRYSREDIMYNIRVMKGICLRLIAIISEHCSIPERHRA
jgi:hypothetical protein